MPTLLVFCYSLEMDDVIFSHQRPIIERLAKEYESTVIITAQERKVTWIPQPRITIYEAPWKTRKPFRSSWKFLATLFRVIKVHQPDVVFSFMTETQSALGGLLLKVKRIPHVLWYAHASSPVRYKIASLLVSKVLTSTVSSVPKLKDKIELLGQMINPDIFKFSNLAQKLPSVKFKFVYVGRVDEPKGLEEICRQITSGPLLRRVESLTIFGESSPSHIKYSEHLRKRFAKEILNKQLIFAGKIDRSELPGELKNFHALIHNFEGSLDKVLVEAVMIGLPIVSSNLGFLEEFGSWDNSSVLIPQRDKRLANELAAFFATDRGEILSICQRRYENAIARHSLENWLDGTLLVLKNCHTTKRDFKT